MTTRLLFQLWGFLGYSDHDGDVCFLLRATDFAPCEIFDFYRLHIVYWDIQLHKIRIFA